VNDDRVCFPWTEDVSPFDDIRWYRLGDLVETTQFSPIVINRRGDGRVVADYKSFDRDTTLLFDRVWDTTFDQACQVETFDDGTTRCVSVSPTTTFSGRYFSDANCSMPVALWYALGTPRFLKTSDGYFRPVQHDAQAYEIDFLEECRPSSLSSNTSFSGFTLGAEVHVDEVAPPVAVLND
jgi:hypothetical protein